MTAQSVLGYTLAGTGTALIVIAALGMIRLPDAYNRANAVAKAAALGVVCVLLGVLVLDPDPFTAVVLTAGAAAQLLTTPFAAYAVGRGAYRSNTPAAPSTRRDDLPAPPAPDRADGP
ncbi:cation:proton antiporter [Streptomyces fradiae]|uniref:cation:proton antiporter n=1 Tax=Streptomyces fradiae TaxID=1906 RepID=UPI00294226F2|nr:monovalent cation/H(+) antiporter subunit G [Streptomyces fradiae]WOI61414.1 monovalent cation/H(+) antiporter subunit G [Streptomyces fradiae]